MTQNDTPRDGAREREDAPDEPVAPEASETRSSASFKDAFMEDLLDGSGETGSVMLHDPAATIDVDPRSPPRSSEGPLAVGKAFGDYLIIRKLGQGGMGSVYEAKEIDSGRPLALKVLSHDLDSPDSRKRFLREGRLAASINHPKSVYVYSTEEIDGTPVITMELVHGGTLQDELDQNGPLPIEQAVDSILQVIDGLEAAHAGGVLHRDIKPANCFVDENGDVKIGDFGLSISSGPRLDTQVTAAGTFLGTPAFSSPEQLRGDELDVRSDIYSIGVTLYVLLSGKAPFEGKNVLQLLANALERTPEPPTSPNAKVPNGLTRAVLRCLEKNPEKRFSSYHDLRSAIAPFGSTQAEVEAAPLGLRFGANLIDSLIVHGIPVYALANAIGDSTAKAQAPIDLALPWWWGWLLAVGGILYFGLIEGVWSTSPGKALFKLRIVDDTGGSIGLPKAFARILLLQGASALSLLCENVMLRLLSSTAISIAIISTMRRRNGNAAIHDLLTRTRVVRPRAPAPQLTSSSKAAPSPALLRTVELVGPYQVLETLRSSHEEELLSAHDERLSRSVWIRRYRRDPDEVSSTQHTVARRGRLRWLAGRRKPDEYWDAYEAPDGQAFLDFDKPQSWGRVRQWLLDLAEELEAALEDSTMPEVLTLDRIWITADGRAKLLDFAAPDEFALRRFPENDQDAAPAVYLHQVAITALEGKPVTAEEATRRTAEFPLPIRVLRFLERLSSARRIDFVREALKGVPAEPEKVGRWRRAMIVAASSALPLLCFLPLFWVVTVLDPSSLVKPNWDGLSCFPAIAGGALGTLAIIMARLFRGDPVIHLSQVAFVTRDGREASRLRVAVRSIATWGLPVIAGWNAFVFLYLGRTHSMFSPYHSVQILFGIYAIGSAYAIWNPQRGWQDMIAGTYMVPK